MSDRCEPPEELRGVDGWHWLRHPGWGEWPARYSAPCHAGVWPIWQCPDSNWTTPAAHREGWRYLAPVTPPAEVDALRAEASEWCQKAQLFEDRITRLRAELAAAREALKECADELEAYIMREYSGDMLTPDNALRRARDLAVVDAARAALGDTP